MSTETQETVNAEESQRFTGRVKWFNNKAGYGFITVTDGDKQGTDIFVHHTGVVVDREQYKYLVQGEYVSFDLKKMDSGEHEFHAVAVRGVNSGMLMCETRNESRAARPKREDGDGDWSTGRTRRPQGAGGRGGYRGGRGGRGRRDESQGVSA